MTGKSLIRSEWTLLVLILALSALVRLLYLHLFSQLFDWDQLTVDNWYHHNWAMSIVHGDVVGDTTYFRAPLYVWCLAAVYSLFGPSLWVARLFGMAIGVTSVLMTYLIARRLVDHRTGLIAAAVQSVCPIMIQFEAELLLDPLFTLLVQVTFLCVLAWQVQARARWMFLSLLSCGLAALTRPTVLVFVPLIGVWLIWRFRRSRAILWRHAVAALLGLSLTVGVVFCRNLIVAQDPVLIASQGGINLYISNNDSADGLSAAMPEPLGHNWRIADISHIAERDLGQTLKPGEISSYWTNKAVAWIYEHPGRFIQLTLKRLWFGIANIEISNNRLIPSLYARIWLLNYNPVRFGILLMLAAAGLLLSRRLYPGLSLVLWTLLGFTAVNAPFFFNSRFRLPLMPFLIILGAAGISVAVRERRLTRWLPAVFAAALAALLSFYPWFHVERGVSTQELLSKGLALYNRADYSGALAYFRQAAEYDASFPETNLNIGAAMLKLGEGDSAQFYFEKETRLHRNRPQAYINLGALWLVRGDFGSAQDFAFRSLQMRPYDASAAVLFIRAMSLDSTATAETIWSVAKRTAAATKDNPWVCTEAGAALEEHGDLSHAEFMYMKAVQAKDLPVETDDQLFEQGYDQILHRRRQKRAEALMGIGSLAGRRGEYAQAAMYSRRAIDLDPTLASAYVNLVSAEFSLGAVREADSILNVALGLFPSHPLIQKLAGRRGQ